MGLIHFISGLQNAMVNTMRVINSIAITICTISKLRESRARIQLVIEPDMAKSNLTIHPSIVLLPFNIYGIQKLISELPEYTDKPWEVGLLN